MPDSDVQLTTSLYTTLKEDINATLFRALEEQKEQNVVAIMGMQTNLETQLLRTASRALPYLNLDISLTEQYSDPLVTREAHYSFLTASVLVSALKSFNVTRCALVRSPNTGPSIEEFEQFANQYDITADVHVEVPLDDFEGAAVAEAVRAIKKK
eukprot:CAMPEP_0196572844 /NCGR_PEP_ID=MMETSP1081-20130531/2823_1 /TAXON_ID=36882 /ORGANISM="Pyramimonas amylifera, Strain CCMP720" /LENGTH=154 /DNA_ID=CAMNT_0041890305 /DNA_START=145 /DNA_END=606 /DNA_ORIENTATION=+